MGSGPQKGDGMKNKIFFAIIVLAFSIGVAFASNAIVTALDNGLTTRETKYVSSPMISWKYMTVQIKPGNSYDFSGMLDDGWQMSGIQLENDKVYIKFRKAIK
jgi:hypothetical protein